VVIKDNVKVVILAAGRGKRMAPLTDTKPKTLVEINGKTFLERLIDVIHKCGVEDIVVVVGYKKEQMIETLKKYPNVEIVENDDYKTTDNMYSLMLCEEKCKDRSLMVLMADIVLGKELLETALNVEGTKFPVEMDPNLKDGQRVLLEDGLLKGISKTLPAAQATCVNIYTFSKEDAPVFFNEIKNIVHNRGKPKEWIEEAIMGIKDKINIGTVDITGKLWLEVDDVEDLKKASAILRKVENV